MYKIPEDILQELENEYPKPDIKKFEGRISDDILQELKTEFSGIDIKQFVHELFTKIISKTLKDSSCSIRELGRFMAFKAYSTRLCRDIVKMKFRIANSLVYKIRGDEYLLNNLPVQANAAFTEEHQQKCSDPEKNHIKQVRAAAKAQTSIMERKKTSENLALNEVQKMLK